MVIEIYTDGAASPNPGVGGAAAIIKIKHNKGEYIKKVQLHEKESTNQRMEISAVIIGLIEGKRSAIDVNKELYPYGINFVEPIKYIVYSDSAYVVNCMKQKWYVNWKKNGWVNSKKQPVANKELWEILLDNIDDILSTGLDIVSFEKVKGHADNVWNNEVDKLAVDARLNLKGNDIKKIFV